MVRISSTRVAILSVFFYRVTLLKLITDCWFYILILVLLFVLEILIRKNQRKKISFFIFFIID